MRREKRKKNDKIDESSKIERMVWTVTVATSTGYPGRRSLPWLACNVARACAQIPFKVQFYVAPQVYLAKTLQGRHKEIHRPGYTVLQIDG